MIFSLQSFNFLNHSYCLPLTLLYIYFFFKMGGSIQIWKKVSQWKSRGQLTLKRRGFIYLAYELLFTHSSTIIVSFLLEVILQCCFVLSITPREFSHTPVQNPCSVKKLFYSHISADDQLGPSSCNTYSWPELSPDEESSIQNSSCEISSVLVSSIKVTSNLN